MKTIIKEITKILTITLLAMMVTSCNNEDDAGANLSFSRSIYVLPATGSLNIELKASVAPENDLIVPITIDGSAVLDDEYEISAKEFIIKAGETNAQITITPKNNLAQGKEIRLSINPVAGYSLGDKNVAIIPIETKERIMYSFTTSYSRILSSIQIWVEIQGEISGRSYIPQTDIVLPLKISSSSTAELDTDFEIENHSTSITIPKGTRQVNFSVNIVEGAEDYAGKEAILELKAPEGEDPDLYYAGSFTTFTVKLDQLKFIDLLGKWKPVELSNEDGFYVWGEEELPSNDFEGKLPKDFAAGDYLEFTNEGGVDRIIPHMTGGLKKYFCGPEHKVTFDHINKEFLDASIFDYIMVPYFKITNINKLFSTKTEIGDALLGLDKIDDNNIYVYIHDYIPTDFFTYSYEQWGGFDAEMFGITYKFTRVEEE